jgi:hypothetical protein
LGIPENAYRISLEQFMEFVESIEFIEFVEFGVKQLDRVMVKWSNGRN